VNLKSKDEENDKELQIHSTSIEPDKIILQKRHPPTPQTPRNSSSDDISDDELDFLMKKLKNT
jgi:hypothetical protein